MTMILLTTTVFLLCLKSAFTDDCEPGFADSCFTGVTSDIKYMLNLKESVARNVSQNAVHDLCAALDDSFNCTSDIIDEDCSESEGRVKFDSWIKALRAAYNYVCGNDHSILKDILKGIQCWSIDEFLLCSQEYLKLTHVEDLLHTEIDEVECKNFEVVTSQCWREATTGSCREQDDISAEVGFMLTAFFRESGCRIYADSQDSAAVSWTVPSGLLNLIVTLVMIL